jgi:hypothetical protein
MKVCSALRRRQPALARVTGNLAAGYFLVPMACVLGILHWRCSACRGVSLLTGKRGVLTAGLLGWMILAVAVISYAFRALAGQGSVGELMNTAKDIGVGGGVFLFAILPGGQKPANQEPKTVEANALMS